MLFGIDVRKEICKRYEDWNDFICFRTDLKCKIDDEKNEMVRDYATQAMELLDKVVDIKAYEMKKATERFEHDFVLDVLENQDFYKMKNEID